MQSLVRLRILGPVQVERDDKLTSGLESRKAQALVSYLAVHARPVPREALVGLLWSEKPEARGRANLSWVLNRVSIVFPNCLKADRQTVCFQPTSSVWLDIYAFEELEAIGQASAFADAVELYRGEFLEGLSLNGCAEFEIWLAAERERWRQRVSSVLEKLIAHHSRQGEYEQSLSFASRLLTLEPWREATHRQVMQLLAWSGQRGAALAQYETCRRTLADELGVEPEEETATLYEQIKLGKFPIAHSPTDLPAVCVKRESLSPFVVGPPITIPCQFFGRKRELKRIFDLWRRFPLQHVAVIGQKRSGKTSLLYYLKNVTRATPTELRPNQRTDWLLQPERYQWALVDLQDARMAHQDGLLRHLLTSLDLPVPSPCGPDAFMDIVSRHVQTPTVILMDEIAAGLASPELDESFWWSLRSLVSHYAGGNLAFVLTSHAPLIQLAQAHGKPSPFFNIFHTLELGPLTEAEALELIANSPRAFALLDVDWIMEQSGRWPCLLQILCQTCLTALEEGQSENAWHDEGLRQIAPFRYLLSQ